MVLRTHLESYQLLRVKGSDRRGIHSLSVMDKKTLRLNGFNLNAVSVVYDENDTDKPVRFLVVTSPSYWNGLLSKNVVKVLAPEMAYVVRYRTSIFKKRIFAVESVPDETDNCVTSQELGYVSIKGLGKVYYAIEEPRTIFFKTISKKPSGSWGVSV